MTLPVHPTLVQRLLLARWINPFRPLKSVRQARLLPMFVALLLCGTAPVFAQNKANVQVDLSKPRAMFFATSIGTAAEAYDGNVYSAATWQLLQDAGITNLRYPGNGGIDALYHFST
jgi:hypothetical protein